MDRETRAEAQVMRAAPPYVHQGPFPDTRGMTDEQFMDAFLRVHSPNAAELRRYKPYGRCARSGSGLDWLIVVPSPIQGLYCLARVGYEEWLASL